MAEFLSGGSFLLPEDERRPDINVDMLDFEYISKCSDPKKVRGILEVLQSGAEGHYPDLEKCAEDRLLNLLPEKERQKLMRLKHKTTAEEILEAESDLENRCKDISSRDALLRAATSSDESRETKSSNSTIFDASDIRSVAPPNKMIPPVRGTSSSSITTQSISINMNSIPSSKGEAEEKNSRVNEMTASKRISGYDFKAWEKFDVEGACEEVEKASPPTSSIGKQKNVDLMAAAADKRSAAHHKEMEQLQTELGANNLSGIQRTTRAAREKVKGNECHRIGENQEAFACYSRSLALDPSSAVVYANRAISCIRLERYELAEDDCSRALGIDKNYIKAWARRGMARFKRGNYKGAAEDFDEAASREPSNTEFKTLAENAALKYYEVEGRHLSNFKARVENTATTDTRSSFSIPIIDAKTGLDVPLPKSSAVELAQGIYTITRPVIADDVREHTAGFTRIAICENESDDDDSVHVEETSSNVPGKSPDGVFTRISICEDDDDDEDEDKLTVETEWDIDVLKQRAMKELSIGNFSMAISLLESGLSSSYFGTIGSPQTNTDVKVSLLNLLAAAVSSTENYQRTIEVCGQILSHQPNNFKALRRRADAHVKVNNQDMAIADYKLILALDPGDSEVIAILSSLDPESQRQQHERMQTMNNIQRTNASMKLKEKGNEAMSRQMYAEAAALYTESIANDPDNITSYNNRAQAYLKLSRFVEAEKDASFVMGLEMKDKSSSHYKKAAFRRASALRGMGGRSNISSAITVLEELAILDPGNKDVKLELSKSVQLLNDMLNSARLSNPISPMVDMSERTSTKRTPTIINHDSPSSSTPVPSLQQAVHSLAESTSDVKKSTTTSPNKISSSTTNRFSKNAQVPSTPPTTLYELERNWRALKTNSKLFADYLKCFKASTFKKVFKESVSSELLSSMMLALRDHSEPDDIITVLSGLSLSPGFNMAITMLPSEDTQNLVTIFSRLEVTDKVNELRMKYKV